MKVTINFIPARNSSSICLSTLPINSKVINKKKIAFFRPFAPLYIYNFEYYYYMGMRYPATCEVSSNKIRIDIVKQKNKVVTILLFLHEFCHALVEIIFATMPEKIIDRLNNAIDRFF